MLTRRNPAITAAKQILNVPNRMGQDAGEAFVRSPWRAWVRRQRYSLALALVAAAVFFGCMVSPPSLMDDIDASHAQLARNMIRSGDWVIPRLDGVPYVEKAPLPYWLIAVSYLIFGVHDWAARIPFALAAALLCWITARYGRWAFDSGGALKNSLAPDGAVPSRAGFYAGLVLATCVGLFLFTRTLLPDVMAALCVCIAFWAFQRALDEDAIAFAAERHPRRWAALLAAALGVGVMLKGLIALVVLMGGAMAYLAITRHLFRRETWRRLHMVSGACIFLIIAAPWHVLAALRLPPAFAFTLHSGPGQYHGFFWFYFINEHVLRFLGLRYPHDYNTVPRPAFWLFNLLWLFPWSVYLPAVVRLSYKPVDRAGRTRLLALCWISFLMLFFTFSTTQEYYSLPIYPALALLLGCAMNAQSTKESGGRWLKRSNRILGTISAAAAMAVAFVLYAVRRMPAPGDIAHALHQQNIQAYTLSLGHVRDLTINSFAYLRGPLVLAGLAFLVGAAGAWLLPGRRAFAAIAVMMVLFFHASRLALVVLDPYLSSRPLAEALRRAPEGPLIVDGDYYPFSSVFFYSDRTALLLNGRMNNLEYGSYAPGAPSVFIDDQKFEHLWASPLCYYLVTDGTRIKPLGRLAGAANLHVLAESGGKFLLTNHLTSGETEIRSALW
ncbi:MAG TPA: glycosyltransferase family 39 protein [Candidatus Angelobacter sp.]